MVTRLLLFCLCLGILRTVTGCAVEFPAYGTSSFGRGVLGDSYGPQASAL